MAHTAPVPHMKVMHPSAHPQPGQVIIGYELVSPEIGCCKCHTLKPLGFALMLIFIFICPIVSCCICCAASCHMTYQRPIYGHQGQMAVPMATIVVPQQHMYQQQQPVYHQPQYAPPTQPQATYGYVPPQPSYPQQPPPPAAGQPVYPAPPSAMK